MAMHLPADLFGGRTPEQRAAASIQAICLAVAVRVVLAQLGGGGEGGDLPPTPQFTFLRGFLERRPLSASGQEEWLAELMTEEQGQLLAVRIMEVRQAFCAEEFDWQQCRQLAADGIQAANVRLLRQHAARAFGSSLAAGGEEGRQEG